MSFHQTRREFIRNCSMAAAYIAVASNCPSDLDTEDVASDSATVQVFNSGCLSLDPDAQFQGIPEKNTN